MQLRFLLICTLLSLACGAQPPNVVLIVVDDLGWMDVGYQGNGRYRTPNIDRLSRQSVRFTDGYAAASNCAPSRASLMTGRYAAYTGVYTVGSPDRGDDRTRRLLSTPNSLFPADSLLLLPEYLHRNGYRTGTFGKWHIGEEPREQGFDVNVAGASNGHPRTYFSPYGMSNLADGPRGEYLPDRLTGEAIRFVDENADRPFFLYLPFYTVHSPIQAPDSTVDRYCRQRSDDKVKEATYDAMVELMDRNVGRLLDRLDRDGLQEHTIVIFTSDNGGVDGYANQDPLRAGKGSYYEGGTRVPLLIRWTGHIEPRVDTTPVTSLDFYPTLASLAGVAGAPPNLDGTDLSQLLLAGKPLAERTLFWHFPLYLEGYRNTDAESRDPLFRTRPGSTLRRGKWKLHEYFEDGGVELYDLESDLGERENLAVRLPEVRDRLLAELRAWRRQVGAPVPDQPNPAYDGDFEAEALRRAKIGN